MAFDSFLGRWCVQLHSGQLRAFRSENLATLPFEPPQAPQGASSSTAGPMRVTEADQDLAAERRRYADTAAGQAVRLRAKRPAAAAAEELGGGGATSLGSRRRRRIDGPRGEQERLVLATVTVGSDLLSNRLSGCDQRDLLQQRLLGAPGSALLRLTGLREAMLAYASAVALACNGRLQVPPVRGRHRRRGPEDVGAAGEAPVAVGSRLCEALRGIAPPPRSSSFQMALARTRSQVDARVMENLGSFWAPATSPRLAPVTPPGPAPWDALVTAPTRPAPFTPPGPAPVTPTGPAPFTPPGPPPAPRAPPPPPPFPPPPPLVQPAATPRAPSEMLLDG